MNTYHLRAAMDWSDESIRLIATPSLTAKSMFFYVQEVGAIQALPQYFTEREHLNSYLIAYTIAGRGYLKYKNEAYTLLPGQAFFIDCMDYQYYHTDPDQLWNLLWLHFNGSSSRLYFEQYSKQNPPVISLSSNTALPASIKKIIELHTRKDIRTEPISSKLIVDILTELLVYSTYPEGSLKPDVLPDYIIKATDFIEKRYPEKISLHTLAEACAISKFHLSREFKKVMGVTPNEYLILSRMNAAKELLIYSDLPVAEIAERVGIDHTSHFIHLFKKQEELTPLAFRKKWQSLEK